MGCWEELKLNEIIYAKPLAQHGAHSKLSVKRGFVML